MHGVVSCMLLPYGACKMRINKKGVFFRITNHRFITRLPSNLGCIADAIDKVNLTREGSPAQNQEARLDHRFHFASASCQDRQNCQDNKAPRAKRSRKDYRISVTFYAEASQKGHFPLAPQTNSKEIQAK